MNLPNGQIYTTLLQYFVLKNIVIVIKNRPWMWRGLLGYKIKLASKPKALKL